jgi:hypothetical protein
VDTDPNTTGDGSFPWPPPKGSDERVITRQVTQAIAGKTVQEVTLGDVSGVITHWLPAGTRLTYYATPDQHGFAAVTELDSIDQKGKIARSEGNAGVMGIVAIAGKFFSLPKGHYRTFAFLVTGDSIIESDLSLTEQRASGWGENGCRTLPPQLAQNLLNDQRVILRVYEIASSGSESHLVTRGALPLSQHLAGLGLKLDGL